MTDRKRVNIKAILTDPLLRSELHRYATEFICSFARVPSRNVPTDTETNE